jgi:hypothetical protein
VDKEVSLRRPFANVIARWLMVGLGLLLAGCTNTDQIVKAPFISPVVVPSTNPANNGEFLLQVAVHNYDTVTSPDLWLQYYSEYWPNCTAAWCSRWPDVFASPETTGPPSGQSDCLHVGVLAPDAGWGVGDYTIDRGTLQCMGGACPGHLWLTLSVDPRCGQRFTGPSTGLHVNWAEDGALSRQKISEF